ATVECTASDAYKRAIVAAGEDDIVHSERITGVPVAVIRTPTVERLGLRAGPVAHWMLRGRRRKHWMRTLYALRSLRALRRTALERPGHRDYWQAGKSVADIDAVEPAASIIARFAAAARTAAQEGRRTSR
ncbi:MAG: nitronate monooxygenase, partial [Gemmatimonadota bacterium]